MTDTPSYVECWEYRTVEGYMDDPPDLDEMNEAGREGWEAYSVTRDGARHYTHMKRRIPRKE
jgi:hypothetical protein